MRVDCLLTGQQLNLGDELASAREWSRLALGTDASLSIYRTMTRVSAGLASVAGPGSRLMMHWWKGWCQNFFGFLPASPLPVVGGVGGGEVGICRRIPVKARPTSRPFLPPLVEAEILGHIARVSDNELGWPAPDLGAEIEFRLTNPVTGTEFFLGKKQRSYWLAQWMDDSGDAQYRRGVGVLNPAIPEFVPGNSRAPVDPSDYVMQFAVNGKVYDSIPAGRLVIRAQRRTMVGAVSRSAHKLDIIVTVTDGRTWSAAWEPCLGGSWHGWWSIG